VVAIAAGIETAGPVAILHAEPDGVTGGLVLRLLFRRDQKLHGGHLLLRMLRQMRGIVAVDEAGMEVLSPTGPANILPSKAALWALSGPSSARAAVIATAIMVWRPTV